MRTTKTTVALFFLIALSLFSSRATLPGLTVPDAAAQTQDQWMKDFEEVCSKTQDAMTFDVAELKRLIQRCEQIQAAIAKMDESQKKVYTRRLKMCKDLYVFVLETKETPQK